MEGYTWVYLILTCRMTINRRDILIGVSPLIVGAALTTDSTPADAKTKTMSVFDLSSVGIKPNTKQPQTKALQQAIDQASKLGQRLILPGGSYLTGPLTLRSGLHFEGVGGQTKLVFAGGAGLILGKNISDVTLAYLNFDGRSKGFSNDQVEGLISLDHVNNLTLENCHVTDSLLNGVVLHQSSGRVCACSITKCAVTGVFSLDAKGLEISHNQLADCGNNGILVWTSQKQFDGTIIAHNRIERIKANAGGTGQNGNGINIFRAGSVSATNNTISDCTFSAIRNNGGDNVQILNNSCTKLGEVALYSEFSFEGAIISNNLVDDAHVGISITNFNEGGRLATATGNLIRNIKKRKGVSGIGIAVEADTMVTGNVIETVDGAGIGIGWDKYLRHVTANNNLVRNCDIGIGISTHNEAGFALIATNMITGSKRGAIRAMDKDKPLGKDLSKNSTEAFLNLAVYGNVSL